MTLTELRYIVALARTRHFGRAAEACFVSQPTLSVAVRKLESELGVALFERRRQEAVPTPAGARIVEQAQRVLEEAERIRLFADESRDPLVGPLRLGAIYTIGPYVLPQLIPALHERAPQMPLVIEEGYTAQLSERLRLGELDAILIALPFEAPGLVTLPLYHEPFMVVVPADHPWRAREAIDPAELASEPLLMLGQGHCFRDQVLDACPACAARLEQGPLGQTVAGTSLETLRHMVASGLGITVLPCSAVGAERYAQRLLVTRRFREPAPGRRVALAWRKSFPRPGAIDALREALMSGLSSCLKPV
ncbi:hydrogen peroxide-inducible genes activator [Thiohalobacter sp.]|uniref:hydrogen peroxide-inducible genes activator n=1 Tax=Thiohalobacter sp. TaxID=2025948 RepID=UPI0026041814|nr:hydrogen peroxide-inducible genes activator [Thiohalobacter sp.]